MVKNLTLRHLKVILVLLKVGGVEDLILLHLNIYIAGDYRGIQGAFLSLIIGTATKMKQAINVRSCFNNSHSCSINEEIWTLDGEGMRARCEK